MGSSSSLTTRPRYTCSTSRSRTAKSPPKICRDYERAKSRRQADEDARVPRPINRELARGNSARRDANRHQSRHAAKQYASDGRLTPNAGGQSENVLHHSTEAGSCKRGAQCDYAHDPSDRKRHRRGRWGRREKRRQGQGQRVKMPGPVAKAMPETTAAKKAADAKAAAAAVDRITRR